METHKKRIHQIRYGSLASYMLIFINMFLGIVYTPWILEKIGTSHYGLYTLAVSLISVFLLDFGMKDAVTRFIAKYRAENKEEEINEFVGIAVKFYGIVVCMLSIVLVCVWFFLPELYSNLTQEELELFSCVYGITATLVVVCFPVNICNGVLNAFEEYIALKLSDVFNKIGTVIITVIALAIGGDVLELVLINGMMNFVTLIVKVVLIKRNINVKIKLQHSNSQVLRETFSFSMWTSVSSLAQQMFFNMIPSVLAMVSDTFSITLYAFANTIEGYVWNISEAINGLFIPTVSRRMVGKENAKAIFPLMVSVGRLNLSVVTLLLIGLTALGREFVHLWLGDDFINLYYCILLLAWPYYISAAQQIAGNSLVVMNKVKYPAIIVVIFGCFNLVTSYFVGKCYGVIGVCLVTSIAFLLRIVATNILYWNVLCIDLLSFFRECHLKMLGGQLACGISLIILNEVLPVCTNGLFGWPLFLLKIVIICFIYFVLMWLLGWNCYEKNLIKSFFRLNANL